MQSLAANIHILERSADSNTFTLTLFTSARDAARQELEMLSTHIDNLGKIRQGVAGGDHEKASV